MPPAAALAAWTCAGELQQILGPIARQEVLLQQPTAHVVAKAKALRNGREELWYQLAFEGYPSSEAEWFPAGRILAAYPGGRQLLEGFEAEQAQGQQQQQQQREQPASAQPQQLAPTAEDRPANQCRDSAFKGQQQQQRQRPDQHQLQQACSSAAVVRAQLIAALRPGLVALLGQQPRHNR